MMFSVTHYGLSQRPVLDLYFLRCAWWWSKESKPEAWLCSKEQNFRVYFRVRAKHISGSDNENWRWTFEIALFKLSYHIRGYVNS